MITTKSINEISPIIFSILIRITPNKENKFKKGECAYLFPIRFMNGLLQNIREAFYCQIFEWIFSCFLYTRIIISIELSMSIILASEIRQKYLDFFRSKQHAIIPSAPLVPENDPSVLFNTAGMQPLVPYLLGEPHPLGRRLADVQKCVRTGDIDDVGDDTHCTFFEMLGNWSLGDYFKRESIEMSWEFLTSKDWLALDPQMISVTVFE